MQAVESPDVADDAIRQKFAAALDALIEDVKQDRSILAALLCGSLSHDTVWRKSDIDLVLITVDDRKIPGSDLSLYADGVNVHAMLMPRLEFRRVVEGSLRNSFAHSFLAKGKLLYTHDPSLEALCAGLADMGRRDRDLRLLHAACAALASIDKAHKWFVTRGDLDYTALWVLYAATPLAQIEVISAGQLVDREVIPQAVRINPSFFATIYSDLLNSRKNRRSVEAALAAVDGYMAERAPVLFAAVMEHLRDVGEARSCRELEEHFRKNFGIGGVTIACEYLADRGLIGKASTTARLTRRSNVDVQELAFFHHGDAR